MAMINGRKGNTMKKIFALITAAALMLTLLALPPVALAEGEAAPAFQVDLTGLITAILWMVFNFVLAFVAKSVVPPLKKFLEEKTTDAQRKSMWDVIVKLVEAAEQMIGNGKGAEKLEYVQKALENAGYHADRALIEAAVKEMNARSLKLLSNAFYTDGVDIDKLTLEELKSFCACNGVDATGCVTREDYLAAIDRAFDSADTQPPTEGGEA